jgi:thiamine pyrophosphokinase
MKHYIIIANGDFLAKDILLEAIQNKVIVALDGAADKLLHLGILPHILLGDFDTHSISDPTYWGIQKTFADLNDHEAPYQGNHGVTLVPCKNQNLTDLNKAIHYCDQLGANSISIVCATGGRLDHHEAALRALRAEYRKDRLILLHTEQQTLRFAKNETISMSGEKGDKCGILAFPQGAFSSTGLEYDVVHYPLNFAFSESIANSLKMSTATLIISGEALLIMPPQLTSQRLFMQKTRRERLELLLRES